MYRRFVSEVIKKNLFWKFFYFFLIVFWTFNFYRKTAKKKHNGPVFFIKEKNAFKKAY